MEKIYDQREEQYALKKNRAVSGKSECTCSAIRDRIADRLDCYFLGYTIGFIAGCVAGFYFAINRYI